VFIINLWLISRASGVRLDLHLITFSVQLRRVRSQIFTAVNQLLLYMRTENLKLLVRHIKEIKVVGERVGKNKRKISERKMRFPIPMSFSGQVRGRQCRPGEVSTFCQILGRKERQQI